MIVKRSGMFNDLGDELVIAKGFADWGEEGYFVGEAVTRRTGGEERVRPFTFHKSLVDAQSGLIQIAEFEDFNKVAKEQK